MFRQEVEFAGEFSPNRVPIPSLKPIPFIDRDDDRSASFDNQSGDSGILIADTVSGIQYQHRSLGRREGLQGLDDREFLERFPNPGLSTDASSIQQQQCLPIALDGNRDTVTGSTWKIGNDHPRLTRETVHQG